MNLIETVKIYTYMNYKMEKAININDNTIKEYKIYY
jgi:hypothetical protein